MWPFKKKPRNQVKARDKPAAKNLDKPRTSGRWLSVYRVRADNTMRGNEAIYAAVSRIANTVASMPLHLYKGYERQIQDPKTNDFDRAEYILKSNKLQSSKDFQKAYELKSYIEAISDFEKWLKEFGDNEDMENQLYELKLRALEIVGEKNDRK